MEKLIILYRIPKNHLDGGKYFLGVFSEYKKMIDSIKTEDLPLEVVNLDDKSNIDPDDCFAYEVVRMNQLIN